MQQNIHQKLKHFFPYEKNVLIKYLIYVFLFFILGSFVIGLSSFMIAVANHKNLYENLTSLTNFNFAISPIINLVLVITAWLLVAIAPLLTHKNTKKSSVVFYLSFWLLVFAILLNAAIFNFYSKNFVSAKVYLSVSFNFLKFIMIITIFATVATQIYFWIMRRKFTFMPSDYEIYSNRVKTKKALKAEKKAIKLKQKQTIKNYHKNS